MRKIIILIIACITIGCIASCTNEKDMPKVENIETLESNFANDPLIINLIAFNDSIISNSQLNYLESRSFWSKFKGIIKKVFTVVAADVIGFATGAGAASTICPVASPIIGGIVSVGCSVNAYKISDLPSNANGPKFHFGQRDVELAYVNARMDEELVRKEIRRCPQLKINIPKKYEECYRAGIYHNVSIRLMLEKAPLRYTIYDYFNEEVINALSTPEFGEMFEETMTYASHFSLQYYAENSSKVLRVIELFLDALEEYPEDFDDVNYLINSYIEIIEKDQSITESDKEAVYSSLSTAAFSLSYWGSSLDNRLN